MRSGRFVLVFAQEGQARSAARDVRRFGFDAEVREGPSGWVVVAVLRTSMRGGERLLYASRLRRIAEANGGSLPVAELG